MPLAAVERRELARLIRLGLPLYCGGRNGRDVALTFDDGPGPYTAHALRILRHAHAQATFFLVGKELRSWPGLPQQERAVGALGDHTWTHRDLVRLSRPEVASELARAKAAIAKDSHAPVELFRPPYEAHDAAVDREARTLGMLEVLWSIDSRDSEGTRWKVIGARVDAALQPGSIVLLHENRGQTIAALKFRILPTIRRLRLHALSVPELLALDPPTAAQLREGLRGCSANRQPAQPHRERRS